MESKGIIFKILDAVSGTSARTGNPWMMQSFVLEVSQGDHGQYKRKQLFEIFGEDKIKAANLVVGAAVNVSFDLEAHEYEGKWYNSTRVWKIEHLQQGQGQVQRQGVQQQPQHYPPRQQYPPQQNVGYFQPTNQYPPQGSYYQAQPAYPQGGYPQQQPFPPQQPMPPQQGGGGGQEDLPF